MKNTAKKIQANDLDLKKMLFNSSVLKNEIFSLQLVKEMHIRYLMYNTYLLKNSPEVTKFICVTFRHNAT